MNAEYINVKSILTSTRSDSAWWFKYNYTMNLYRGCCHGCIYCDSRSDCYQIDDFDRIKIKNNAIGLLREELSRKRKKGIVCTGSMSDPYNPLEKDLFLTRNALKLLSAYNYGTAIFTKSNLIERDIDILKEISDKHSVLCGITITCSDDELSSVIEPNVSSSSQRFSAIKKLTDSGIYAGVLLMPVLPYITDNSQNIKSILDKAKSSGAKFVYPMFGMTLRSGQREYYYKKLDMLYPSLKQKYNALYGEKYSCYSPYAQELINQFKTYCNELNISYDINKINDEYIKKPNFTQLSIFD